MFLYTFFFLQLMAALSCIIHYSVKNSKYDEIKPLSQINIEKIQQAKDIRIEVGGANHHREQCELIPEIIDPKKTWSSLVSLLQKFTQIISKEKKKSSSSLVLKSCKKAILQKYESDRPLKRKRL